MRRDSAQHLSARLDDSTKWTASDRGAPYAKFRRMGILRVKKNGFDAIASSRFSCCSCFDHVQAAGGVEVCMVFAAARLRKAQRGPPGSVARHHKPARNWPRVTDTGHARTHRRNRHLAVKFLRPR